ncbi:MAG: hypothetical protein L3J52_02575 [Proteobacteria bacterium]|nr:hypothetical protein [Pseudomonadota bacterium]
MEDIIALQKKLNIEAGQWFKAMKSNERIELIVASDGKKYWLKKATPARGVMRYWALNMFSKIMHLPLLKAVPQPGGYEAIQTEARRLAEMSKAKVLVPAVIHKGSDFLLLSDIGKSLIDEFKSHRNNKNRIRRLFSGCLLAIRQLHDRDMYMSQGFVRNILKTCDEPLEFGFIDFEDDPLQVMSLAEAQARDLLLYVNSTARFFVDDFIFFEKSINTFLDGHKPVVIKHLKNANQKMMWITKIPLQKLFGHDYQKLKTGILALKNL